MDDDLVLAVPGFELMEHLGRGGYGDVYSARRSKDGRLCALKILRDSTPATISEFKHEARTLWNLRVPGVVTPMELGSNEGLCYVALPLVRGRTADQVAVDLPEVERAPWVRELLRQVGGTVARLHRRGILHLDIKPQNVIWSTDGRATLLDFGFARWMEDAPPGGLRLEPRSAGTPGYMAPELFGAAAPTEASDWFSVGAMGWELLVGRLPTSMPPKSIPARDEPSRALMTLCRGLLQLNPRKRWGSPEVSEFFGWQDDPVPTPCFVGRTQELRAVREARAAGQVLLVQGVAGIGKSSLLTAVEREWESDGELVLSGRCYEHDQLPYRGFEGALQFILQHRSTLPSALVDVLALMFPELEGRVGDVVDATRGRDAFTQALSIASGGRRVTLLIDDLQWIDPDGAALLLHVLEASAGLVSVVGATRPADPPGATELRMVLERRGYPVVVQQLGALPLREGIEMVRTLRPSHTEQSAHEVVVRAAGNTFLLELLTRSESSDVDSTGEVVRAQLEGLDPADRWVIEMLALAARPLDEATLARACWGAGVGDPALERLKQHSWISSRAETGRVGVYHDLLARSVHDGLPEQRILELHTALYQALTDCGSGPADVYPHAHAMGRFEEAARLAEAAGQEAMSRAAFEAARRWFETALEAEELPAVRRVQVTKALALALRGAGRPLQAAQCLRRVDAVPLDIATVLLEGGSVHEGRSLLADALRRERLPIRRSTLATAPSLLWRMMRPLPKRGSTASRGLDNHATLAWTLARGLAYTHPVESLDYAIRAHHAARRCGDRVVELSALAFIGGGVFSNIAPLRQKGVKYLAEALKIASSLQVTELEAAVRVWEGIGQLNQGSWETARPLLTLSLEGLAPAAKRHWDRMTAQQALFWIEWKTGRFGALGEMARRPYLDCLDKGDRLGQAILGQYVAFAETAKGRLPQAREISRWLREDWMPSVFTVQHFYAAMIDCLCALREGDPQTAYGAWYSVQPAFRKAGGERVDVSLVDNCELEIALAMHGCPVAPRRIRGHRKRLASLKRPDAQLVGRWAVAALEGSSPAESLQLGQALQEAGRVAFGRALCLQACVADPSVGDASVHARALEEDGVSEPYAWAAATYPATPLNTGLAPR